MAVYGLWPVNGKPERYATVAAPNEADARRLAKEQDPELAVAWDDPEVFTCEEIATFGGVPPMGVVSYRRPA